MFCSPLQHHGASVNHKLYTDDSQLLLSFSVADFIPNITFLEQTVSGVKH
jgi:hypothetical protein